MVDDEPVGGSSSTTIPTIASDTTAGVHESSLLTESIIALVEHHLPNNVVQWHSKESLWSFSLFFPRLELRLSLDHGGLLKSSIVDTYLKIARTQIDPLRSKVRSALEPISTTEKRLAGCVDASATLLQALDILADFEGSHEAVTAEVRGTRGGWSANDVHLTWDTIVQSTGGLDLSSVKDTAFHLLGKTPEQLCAGIPPAFRILHVESVLRPDLAKAFLARQSEIELDLQALSTSSLRRRLSPHSALSNHSLASVRRDDLIKDMSKPRVAYHGTPLQNVASIVRHGFRMPGTLVNGKVVASPRSGIAFDRGIYSSQAPFYALSYAKGQKQKTPLGEVPTMRLFICATLMGRTYRGSGVHGPRQDGYDAHFDGGFEYIVHDKRAMLPCYVVHLDLGAEAAQRALRQAQDNPFAFEEQQRKTKLHRRLDNQQLAPGDLQRQKEAKKAAAMKWFPYGFGSASGTKFVIEEIGDISDDEEDYGQWQEARHGFAKEGEDHDVEESNSYYECDEDGDVVKWTKGPLLDQYQDARKARAIKDK